jgi:hypothetical protein
MIVFQVLLFKIDYNQTNTTHKRQVFNSLLISSVILSNLSKQIYQSKFIKAKSYTNDGTSFAFFKKEKMCKNVNRTYVS